MNGVSVDSLLGRRLVSSDEVAWIPVEICKGCTEGGPFSEIEGKFVGCYEGKSTGLDLVYRRSRRRTGTLCLFQCNNMSNASLLKLKKKSSLHFVKWSLLTVKSG